MSARNVRALSVALAIGLIAVFAATGSTRAGGFFDLPKINTLPQDIKRGVGIDVQTAPDAPPPNIPQIVLSDPYGQVPDGGGGTITLGDTTIDPGLMLQLQAALPTISILPKLSVGSGRVGLVNSLSSNVALTLTGTVEASATDGYQQITMTSGEVRTFNIQDASQLKATLKNGSTIQELALQDGTLYRVVNNNGSYGFVPM